MTSSSSIVLFILAINAFQPGLCSYNLNATELFYIRLNPKLFEENIDSLLDPEDLSLFYNSLLNKNANLTSIDLEYEASLKSMPDLPNWITQKHTLTLPEAFLYGTAPIPGVTDIEVVAFNRKNYKTVNKTISLFAADKRRRARYEVQLKFFDLDIEEMLNQGYHTDLLEIFRRQIWIPEPRKGERDDVYITLLKSAIDMGFRRPHKPTEKEGVVIRIGSVHPFPAALLKIETEVKVLYKYSPCPRNFKITSGYKYFSKRHQYFVDWCEFKLFTRFDEDGDNVRTFQKPSAIPVYKDEEYYFQPPAAKSHTRNLLLDFILCIVIPMAVIMLMLFFLTFIMFCNRESKKENTTLIDSIEMSQFNSIQHASNKLREMAINREQPMLALPAPSSTDSIQGNSMPRSVKSGSYSPRVPSPTPKQSQIKLGAGVRRPSTLRPGPMYAGSSARR